MRYEEVVERLDNMPQFSPEKQREHPFSLQPLQILLARLGNPEQSLSYVHIGGTNGKGSTLSYLESILVESHVKVGSFTSPALSCYEEMYRIQKKEVERERFAAVLGQILEENERLTKEEGIFASVFELLTAGAFLYFQQEHCQMVLLEVGLGGEMDATNVIPTPDLALFTSISLDHTELLGDSLEEIGRVKSGIIKKGGRVGSVPQEKEVAWVLQEKVKEEGGEWTEVVIGERSDSGMEGQGFVLAGEAYHIPFLGRHQVVNASLAIWAAFQLQSKFPSITLPRMKAGLAWTACRGRIEVFQKEPLILLDGGHNPDGVQKLLEVLEEVGGKGRTRFVLGVFRDKDWQEMTDLIFPFGIGFYTLTPKGERGLDGRVLWKKIEGLGGSGGFYERVATCIRAAKQEWKQGEVLCIFGSFSFLEEARRALQGK